MCFRFFILLVILGGISITALTGENGLFGRAKSAGNYYDVESAVSLGAVGTITGNGKIVWNGQATPPTSQTTYTVSFKDGETTLSTSTVGEGQTVARPVTDPTKENYNFYNWYSDSELTNLYDFTSAINGDTIIYAKWTEVVAESKIKFSDGSEVNIITEPESLSSCYGKTVHTDFFSSNENTGDESSSWNWQLFYDDAKYLFLIASDYVPIDTLKSELLKESQAGGETKYKAWFGTKSDSTYTGTIMTETLWSNGAESSTITGNAQTNTYLNG